MIFASAYNGRFDNPNSGSGIDEPQYHCYIWKDYSEATPLDPECWSSAGIESFYAQKEYEAKKREIIKVSIRDYMKPKKSFADFQKLLHSGDSFHTVTLQDLRAEDWFRILKREVGRSSISQDAFLCAQECGISLFMGQKNYANRTLTHTTLFFDILLSSSFENQFIALLFENEHKKQNVDKLVLVHASRDLACNAGSPGIGVSRREFLISRRKFVDSLLSIE